MVERGAALIRKNARAIKLQAGVGADCHRDGLFGHCLLQGRLIIWGHVLVPINAHHLPVLSQVVADAAHGPVGVIGLRIKASILYDIACEQAQPLSACRLHSMMSREGIVPKA